MRSDPAEHRPPVPLWLALAGAVLVGALTAAQARVNGELGLRLEDGLVAAFISFAVGLILIVLISAVTPAGRAGARRLARGLHARTIPWWMVLGGVAGATTVATQGLTVAIIGVSLFTVGVVAGQAIAGLVIDRIGYGPAGVVALTTGRLAGGALALGAVGFTLSGDVLARTPLWMLVLPFAAGMGIAWQQATNGHLRQRVGTPVTATLVNFIGGTLVLTLVAGISIAVRGGVSSLPSEPWIYVGGAIGMLYIFLSAAIVTRTGVLLLGLASVVGQLLTAVLIDLVWPAETGPGPLQAAGMITLAAASVVVATVPWHRLRARS